MPIWALFGSFGSFWTILVVRVLLRSFSILYIKLVGGRQEIVTNLCWTLLRTLGLFPFGFFWGLLVLRALLQSFIFFTSHWLAEVWKSLFISVRHSWALSGHFLPFRALLCWPQKDPKGPQGPKTAHTQGFKRAPTYTGVSNRDEWRFPDPADQSYVQNAETFQTGSSYQKGTKEPKRAQKGTDRPSRAKQWPERVQECLKEMNGDLLTPSTKVIVTNAKFFKRSFHTRRTQKGPKSLKRAQ